MTALDFAYTSLRNGECDAALVCAANIALDPMTSLHLAKFVHFNSIVFSFKYLTKDTFLCRSGLLSKNGYCRPFDNASTGYTRSEAINV